MSLMEYRSVSSIYLLCVPNGRKDWLVDLPVVCPKWKIGVSSRFIYCVPLVEDRSGS